MLSDFKVRSLSSGIALCLAIAGLTSAHPAYALAAGTTTTLQLASGATVGNGIVVTLTATVTSTGTGKPVSPGFVTFCDASAKFCEDLAILGSQAVNASGVATMKKVLPPGTHKISAFFNPTIANAKSISSIQTVDVPVQVKAVPLAIITKTGTSNPLPVQASVSVVGTSPLTGTLSIVQDQGREALVSAPVGTTTTTSGFAPAVAVPPAYSFGGAPIARDFNGDGLPDLITADNLGFGDGVDGTLQVSLNDPTHPGQFVSGQTISSGQVESLIIGDFNNDGALDLLIPNGSYYGDTAPPSYDIFLGEPANPGQFQSGNNVLTVYSSAGFNLAADMNQDGVLDLVGMSQSGEMDIFFGDPAHPGSFINDTVIPVKASQDFVADVNGDGLPDLIGLNYMYPDPATLTVVLGDATHPGQFLAPVTYPLTIVNSFYGTLVGDFNQDGFPDIAVLLGGTTSEGNLNVLLSNPSAPGQFMPAVNYPLPSLNSMVLGDFNGDGTLDIAQVDGSATGLMVLPGDPKGSGKFLTPLNYPNIAPPFSDSSSFITSLTSADFNADGLSDLILALEPQQGELLYSPVNPLLAQQTQTASVSFPSVTYDRTKSPLAQALYSGDDNYGMIGSCDIDLATNPGAPVLYNIHTDVSNTAATVLWYWNGDDGFIDYGTTPAFGSTTGWQHVPPSQLGGPSYLRLTGLAPNTKYYYRIRAIDYFNGCSHWTTFSPTETFTTTP